MTFDDVLRDIEELAGRRLASIRKGAEIKLIGVDREEERVIVENAQGEQRSRPFRELERVWDELCRRPAVHVDSVLSGSGSSRNQPETILASLPYVEWLEVSSKKHLALVPGPSHPAGELKKMDMLAAQRTRDAATSAQADASVAYVVVASDVKAAVDAVERATGVRATSVEPGAYRCDGDTSGLVVSAQRAHIEEGTYGVVARSTSQSSGGSISVPGLSAPVQVLDAWPGSATPPAGLAAVQ